MEAMELELEQTRRLVSGVAGAGSRHSLDPSSPPNTAPSAGAGNGRSEQTNAEEGTLF